MDLFISSDPSINFTVAFPPLGNSDHVYVPIFVDILLNSKGRPICSTAYDYSCFDLDVLCDQLTDVPKEEIFKLGASVAAATEFVKNRSRLEVMFISLMIIRSSFIHLHGFQLLALLS